MFALILQDTIYLFMPDIKSDNGEEIAKLVESKWPYSLAKTCQDILLLKQCLLVYTSSSVHIWVSGHTQYNKKVLTYKIAKDSHEQNQL